MLLEKGANKECKDDFGITPLFVAAQYGKLESLRLLVSHGNGDCSFSFIALYLYQPVARFNFNSTLALCNFKF